MAMTKKSTMKSMAVVACLAGFLATMILMGCTASRTRVAAKPGAQLWGENCGRCHNVRNPAIYSDEQWEVVMLHMQTRANLTSHEADRILEFLQAAN